MNLRRFAGTGRKKKAKDFKAKGAFKIVGTKK